MIVIVSPPQERDTQPVSDRRYRSTSWSLIDSVQHGDPETRTASMDLMIRIYWRPVYWTIRMRWRAGPEDARELTQGFFLYFLDRDLIMKVKRERGRFRAWIKGTLTNFMRDHARRESCEKRGGGVNIVALENLQAVEAAPPSPTVSPDRQFERELVTALIDEALARLGQRAASEGKGVHAEIFRTYYFEEAHGRRLTYEDLGRRFGVGFHDVKNALAEMRLAYRAELLSLIGATTSNAKDAFREILEVFGA